ncbi:MAG: hypothetical protein J6R89_05895 [Clostridia bacterium]|nr:hypothetical protein [Clostridia bacterium]
MRKLFALLLALSLLFVMVACGPDENPGKDDPSKDDGGDVEDEKDYGSEEDPALPDFDWNLPT